MRKFIALVLILCIGTAFGGCGNGQSKEQNVVIPEYEDDCRIELFADISRRAGNDEAVQQYFDAGFTVWVMTEDSGALTDENGTITEAYQNAVKTVSKYGEVWPRNVRQYPYYWINPETTVYKSFGVDQTIPARNITNDLDNMGNVTGYYQWDEPSYEQIESILPLVEWHNEYEKDKVWHINLLPSYGSSAFSMTDLEGYIQHYVDTILAKVESPKNLGLDNYPLLSNKNGNSLRTSYLSDLITLANVAKEYNAREDKTSEIKTGFCIQSFCDGSIRTPESTADITFQVNCCLAMGAKYLEYFLYCPISAMVGLVDTDGEKLPVYDYVKEANDELNQWDHVIMSFDWLGAMTIDGDDIHDNEDAFEIIQARELEKLQMLEKVESRVDTLIGEFVDEDGYYGYMTVNYTEPSEEKIDYVTYTFHKDVKKALVYQNGEPTVYDVDENQQLTIRIPAGGGAFVIPCP